MPARATLARGGTGRRGNVLGCAALCVALCLASGCREEREPPRPSSPVERGTPARPATVIGTWVVPDAPRLWSRLREAQPRSALPKDPRLLLPLLLGLEPTVAGLLSRDAALVGAVVAGEGGPRLVVAIPLESMRELRAVLTTGARAPFRGREAGSVVLLEPKTPHDMPVAAALASGHLVLGPQSDVVLRVAPYVAQVVALELRGAQAPHLELSGERLGELLSASLGASWRRARSWLEQSAERARAAHGGRAADLATPEALIELLDADIDALGSVLRDARRVAITAHDEQPAALEVQVELSAGSAGAQRLKQLPVSRHAPRIEPSRIAPALCVLPLAADDGSGFTAAIGAMLEDRADREALEALALLGQAIDEGVDGALTIAQVGGGRHPAVALRAAVSSASALDVMMRRARAALAARGVRGILERALGGPLVIRAERSRLRIEGSDQTLVIDWRVEGEEGTVFIAAGEGAVDGPPLGKSHLGGAFAAARLAPGGEPLLFGAAIRLEPPASEDSGWLALTVRRGERLARARLEMEPAAAQALSRWLSLPDMLEQP